MIGPAPHLIAHQGGWDEILMVAGPLLVFAAVLWLANRRANARLAEQAADQRSNPADPISTIGDEPRTG